MSIAAIIVAGGMGKRLGEPIPKAFVPLKGKELFSYSLDVFEKSTLFAKIIIVIPELALESTRQKMENFNLTTPWEVVVGGAERWNSVKNGVDAAGAVEKVLIHDAARPFVTLKVINDLIANQQEAPGIITATPVIDTVRHFDGDSCSDTVDRSTMIAVGTPQLFTTSILQECFIAGESMATLPTDEAMLLQECDKEVKFTWGDRLNFKVTTPEDIILAEALITAGAVGGTDA